MSDKPTVPTVRGRGVGTYRRSRSRSRSRDNFSRMSKVTRPRPPPRHDDRFDDDDEGGFTFRHSRYETSRPAAGSAHISDRGSSTHGYRVSGTDSRLENFDDSGPIRRDADRHRDSRLRHRSRSPQADTGGASWRHDMYESSSCLTRVNTEGSSSVYCDDSEPFNPYNVIRKSKAYDPAPPPANHSITGRDTGRSAPATSLNAPTDEHRARSRSPRPSHDDYEWKSLAGGVAIFVKSKKT